MDALSVEHLCAQVFFLTCAGTKVYPDPRMTSVDAALAFAKSSQLQVNQACTVGLSHSCHDVHDVAMDEVTRGSCDHHHGAPCCFAGCSGGGIWHGRPLGGGALPLSSWPACDGIIAMWLRSNMLLLTEVLLLCRDRWSKTAMTMAYTFSAGARSVSHQGKLACSSRLLLHAHVNQP